MKGTYTFYLYFTASDFAIRRTYFFARTTGKPRLIWRPLKVRCYGHQANETSILPVDPGSSLGYLHSFRSSIFVCSSLSLSPPPPPHTYALKRTSHRGRSGCERVCALDRIEHDGIAGCSGVVIEWFIRNPRGWQSNVPTLAIWIFIFQCYRQQKIGKTCKLSLLCAIWEDEVEKLKF